jgi:t-SNARE complex subunit (syntaxin)
MAIGTYNRLDLDEFSDDDSETGLSSPRANLTQHELLSQQDVGLEMLATSADRIGQMALGIHVELNQQNKMLDEMDVDLEEAGENMDYVTKKTQEFIQKSGGTKNFLIILCMIGVVVLLILLILYT